MSMRQFEETELSRTYGAQLALLRRGIGHEVVILKSASEEQLRRMNMRYFCNLEEIEESLLGEIGLRLANLLGRAH
ncbi:MAG: hypothetical protein IT364_08630 [Candidatus Hydrogenedentes bacterium]|nr:hypothetical protein [Candidatus Hydrogenedentota bacterium]